jgi:hypothetical protein
MENYYKKEVSRLKEESKRRSLCIEANFAVFKRSLDSQLTDESLGAITAAFKLGLELGSGDCVSPKSSSSGYSTIEGIIRQSTKNPEKRS